MKIKKGYILRRVGDEGVVVTTPEAENDFKGIIKLNSTGMFIWELLEKGSDEELLVSALLNKYSIDNETALQAVKSFMDTVIKHGFVEV